MPEATFAEKPAAEVAERSLAGLKGMHDQIVHGVPAAK
jgi:hypothetical protein